MIGIPIRTDSITTSTKRTNYARILVNVTADTLNPILLRLVEEMYVRFIWITNSNPIYVCLANGWSSNNKL